MADQCPSFGSLVRLCDGELDSASIDRVENHVRECGACATTLAEIDYLCGLAREAIERRMRRIAGPRWEDVYLRHIVKQYAEKTKEVGDPADGQPEEQQGLGSW